MVLLQDSKLILFHFKTSLCIHVKTSRDILMLRRAVEQSCSPPPAGKGLPTFCLIILGLYYTVRYFITAKKNSRLLFYHLCPVAILSSADQQVVSVLQEQTINVNLAKSTYQI